MNENFAILGMFDRSTIMSVIEKQPASYKFILAAVNAEGQTKEPAWEKATAMSREKEILNNLGIRCNLL